MDNKDLRKMAAEYDCMELLDYPVYVKFLKALYNEAIDDCIDTFEMAQKYPEGFFEKGEVLNKSHFEESKLK